MLCAVLLGLLLCQGAAAASDAVELAFKFAPGDVVKHEVSVSGGGHLRSSQGQMSPIGVRGTLSMVYTTREVLADGRGRVEARMTKASLDVDVGEENARLLYENGRLRWFANGQEHAPPEADLSQLPLMGTPVVLTMSPAGQVSEVALADPRVLGALQQALPGINLGQFRGASDGLFPEGPVNVGETWRRSAVVTPVGPLMPVTVTTSHTLDSYSEEGEIGVAKISGYSEARLQWRPTTVSPGGTEVTVGIPEFRETVTSTEFFNTSEGRLLRGDYEVAFTTRVSVQAGEEEREGQAEARFHIFVQAR